MSLAEVYDAHRITPPIERQILGFTRRAMEQSYAAALRAEATGLGYPDKPVTLTDPQLTQRIDDEARATAARIRRTYNRMLDNALRAQPSTLSDAERLAALGDWKAKTRNHNTGTLSPFITRTARSMARDDFYTTNSAITGTWSVQGGAQCAKCQDAVNGDRSIFLPAHPHCTHERTFTADTSSLPPYEELYLGQADVAKRLNLRVLDVCKYSPSQPRSHGRFASSGSHGGGGVTAAALPQNEAKHEARATVLMVPGVTHRYRSAGHVYETSHTQQADGTHLVTLVHTTPEGTVHTSTVVATPAQLREAFLHGSKKASYKGSLATAAYHAFHRLQGGEKPGGAQTTPTPKVTPTPTPKPAPAPASTAHLEDPAHHAARLYPGQSYTVPPEGTNTRNEIVGASIKRLQELIAEHQFAATAAEAAGKMDRSERRRGNVALAHAELAKRGFRLDRNGSLIPLTPEAAKQVPTVKAKDVVKGSTIKDLSELPAVLARMPRTERMAAVQKALKTLNTVVKGPVFHVSGKATAELATAGGATMREHLDAEVSAPGFHPGGKTMHVTEEPESKFKSKGAGCGGWAQKALGVIVIRKMYGQDNKARILAHEMGHVHEPSDLASLMYHKSAAHRARSEIRVESQATLIGQVYGIHPTVTKVSHDYIATWGDSLPGFKASGIPAEDHGWVVEQVLRHLASLEAEPAVV